MGADDANEGNAPGACLEHEWQLQRAVLDGKGALRVFRCAHCPAESVQPASGDLASRSPRKPESGAGHDWD